MFEFKEKTVVNKQFKIKELLRLFQADKALKEQSQIIESIVLKNVLSEETTGFSATENVKEIYIFDISVLEKQVPKDFITALNKEISLQNLICLRYYKFVKYILPIKEIEDNKVKILKTYETDWVESSFEEMPNVSSLGELFELLLEKITNVKTNELDFKLNISRIEEIEKLRKEIEKLTKQMYNEKQPNFKMELNDKIKLLKKELDDMEN